MNYDEKNSINNDHKTAVDNYADNAIHNYEDNPSHNYADNTIHDYEDNPMNETAFDSMLTNSAAELPPDDIVMKITPWQKGMNRILIGLSMQIFTLNFWKLEYTLPLIGIILSLLGIQTLRRENGWFKGFQIITFIRTAYCLLGFIINATIFQSRIYETPIFQVLPVVNTALAFLLLFCLWQGFRSVQRKAGLSANAGGAAALMVWYAIVCLLALLNYSGGLIFIIILLAVYICIIVNLFRLPRELDEAGYVIQAAPVRVPDWFVVTAVLAFLTAGIACGYLFFHSYPMDWQAAGTPDKQTAEMKTHLAGLGFPKAILDDLTDEDIKECKDAAQVFVDTDYKDGLCMTGIAVQLPGEPAQWKIFHHFLWETNSGCYGAELIQIWPSYRYKEGWEAVSGPAGQVLYDDGTKVYAAPYYSLGNKEYQQSSFFSNETVTDIFAEFSMPKKGKNYRGYLSYTMAEIPGAAYVVGSYANYTHQKSWLQYPVMTAMDNYTAKGFWDNDHVFKTTQGAVIVHLEDGSAKLSTSSTEE